MITADSKLTFSIHSLKQKLSLVSDEATIALSSNDLRNFVEDKVRLQQPGSILVVLT